jgi:D-arabinose 1-dehydrogenase-like Zn-dependent alcohol dehydrogenase
MNGRHFGWSADGGYQQYVVVQQQHVHPFDRGMLFEYACLCATAATVRYILTCKLLIDLD